MEQLMLLDVGPAKTRPKGTEDADAAFDQAYDFAMKAGREAAGAGLRGDALRMCLYREVKKVVVARGFDADQHQYLLNVAWAGADDVVQRADAN